MCLPTFGAGKNQSGKGVGESGREGEGRTAACQRRQTEVGRGIGLNQIWFERHGGKRKSRWTNVTDLRKCLVSYCLAKRLTVDKTKERG